MVKFCTPSLICLISIVVLSNHQVRSNVGGYGYGGYGAPEICQDKQPWCSTFVVKNLHRCYQESYYMLEQCPYSCHQCQKCGDNFARCQEYKKFCHNNMDPKTGEVSKIRMHSHCRETCKICSKSTTDENETTMLPGETTEEGGSPSEVPGPSDMTTVGPDSFAQVKVELNYIGGHGKDISFTFVIFNGEIEKQASHDEASQQCSSANINFSVIKSTQQLQVIKKHISQFIGTNSIDEHVWWLGGHYDQDKDIWSWDNGEAFDLKILATEGGRKPPNTGSCLALIYNKKSFGLERLDIVGLNCEEKHDFICEIRGSPSGLSRMKSEGLNPKNCRKKLG